MKMFYASSLRIATIAITFTGLFSVSAYAQQATNQQNNNQQNGTQQGTGQSVNVQHTGANKGFPGDTVTYVLNGSDLSFDSKRTVIYDDKHTVDSLVNSLAMNDSKKYRIIYKKQGQQAREISAKALAKLDKTGFYKITIAYNKPQLSEDASPLYILSSK